MKTYALIQDGKVYEVISPRTWDIEVLASDGVTVIHQIGDEIDINDLYPPQFVALCVEVPADIVDQIQQNWTYDEATNTFASPVPYVPTAEEIFANNQAVQASLITQASQAMAPVLVSLQLGDATDEETTKAKAWQAYYRALQAVDLTVTNPTWPDAPQS